MVSLGTVRIRSVSIGVGPIEFTVMPKSPNSLAAVRVKDSIAALLAESMASPSRSSGAATLLMLYFKRLTF
jgi:hypothetical protein